MSYSTSCANLHVLQYALYKLHVLQYKLYKFICLTVQAVQMYMSYSTSCANLHVLQFKLCRFTCLTVRAVQITCLIVQAVQIYMSTLDKILKVIIFSNKRIRMFWILFRFRYTVMVFNATFNNISVILWRSVLLVEETGVPLKNHQPVASHWQTLWQNVISSTPCLSGLIIKVSDDKHWLHRFSDLR
jgi:hypothetical protein